VITRNDMKHKTWRFFVYCFISKHLDLENVLRSITLSPVVWFGGVA